MASPASSIRKIFPWLRLLTMLPPLTAAASFSQAGPRAQLPDSPLPQTSQPVPAAQPEQQRRQTKRILGIIPNFRAVSTDTILPPQSVKEKFTTATQDSFDYSSIFIPVVLAGYSLGTNSTPEFGSGAQGYGQYLWRAGADQTIENYMVEFVVPVIARQDTRYYTLGRGGFFKRTGYAWSRVIITRSDAANEQFNVSEVLGAGSSAAISSLYYPSSQRNFSNIGKAWGIDIGIDGISFVLKEFWPDINYHLFHGTRPDQQQPDQQSTPQPHN